MLISRLLMLVMVLSFAGSAQGELIGNTLISEKVIPLEINDTHGRWKVEDSSTSSDQKVAVYSLKDKIKGFNPSVSFFVIPNPDNVLSGDVLLGILQDTFTAQGMTLGPVHMRRYGGKNVPTFEISMTTKQGTVKGMVFLLLAKGGAFFAQFASNSIAYTDALPLAEALIENVKY